MTAKNKLGKSASKLAVLASMAFGFVLIGAMYYFMAKGAGSDPRLYQIHRLIIAFGAGFVAAGVAGTFEIGGEWPPVTVKAGGPIGIVTLIYTVNPPPF